MKNRFGAILGTILLFSLLAVSAVADTGVVACGGPHPKDVVVAPLNVP